MNSTKTILINLIIGFWLIFIAVFSIQNIQLISLKFFLFESIKISVGFLLTLSLAGGFIFGGLIPVLFSNKTSSKSSKKYPKKNIKNSKNNEFQRDWEEEKDPLFDWE
ncbi:DUF1049 domain-containing protein [Geminocystis sp. CENA526]|uniref:lipopolysaccharide assembly protein LapA domain-containing protein n=1 Tax=Geminocystis sp. CENA526 TaxID=1355871 RepID=UPI003D6F83E5